MKKQWFGIGLGVLGVVLAALPLLLSQGCNSTNPTLSSVVPTPSVNGMVSNFAQGSLNTYPAFSSTGYFNYQVTGGAPGFPNMIDGSSTPYILEPNPNPAPGGSPYAIHIWGVQTDYCPPFNPNNCTNPQCTGYPAYQTFCYLKNDPANPLYDVSGYTGIEFWMNIPPKVVSGGVTTGDANPQERFAIGAAPEVPTTTDQGGLCPPPFGTNCYNYFWYQTKLGPTPGWKQFQIPFSMLKMDAGYAYIGGGASAAQTLMPGSAVAFNYTGLNKGGTNCNFEKQALFLLWKFTDNGACGTTNTDYWIDNVQFY